ncbi:hypothetical protein FJY69_07345 [candidate division WOR-3 bacterium]|nr:hypothetical protein [candidate division WOR-3 bacterium]
MADERELTGDQLAKEYDLTDEFVDAVAAFSDALVTGQNPDLDRYVARFPQFAPRLREYLETAIWLRQTFEAARNEYPGIDVPKLARMKPGQARRYLESLRKKR